jgi:hypothetical protein
MSDSNSPALRRLRHLAGGGPGGVDSEWNNALDPIGLISLTPPRSYGYWCTPLNSLTFAVTGGDGVHYGLLAVDGKFTDFSPVVMTVPMCDTPNTIVGAGLEEFLALGCRYGYFALEQLVYNREATLRELELARYAPEMGQEERALLTSLSSEFRLEPWANPARRLEELRMEFASAIQLPSQVDGAD